MWPPLRLARVRCERGSVVAVLPVRNPLIMNGQTGRSWTPNLVILNTGSPLA